MKKLTMMLLALVLCTTSIFTLEIKASAEDIGEDIPYEELLTDEALIGETQLQTRGVYLSSGTSIINDAGGGKIGAGGITSAAKRCTVSVNAIVERKSGSSWVRVTSWTVTNQNSLVASASKAISVGSGYYYRVRCVHRASSDVSNSFTDALWM